MEKYFKSVPFATEDKYELSTEAVNNCLAEATRWLEYHWDSFRNIRQNSSMVIVAMSAMLVAFVGSFFSAAENGSFILGVVAIVGLVLSAAPIAVLIYGVFYKRSVYHAGASPSFYLCPDVMKWLEDMRNWNPEIYNDDKYLKLLQLQELQNRIMENEKEKRAQVRFYRLSLYLSLAAAVILLLLFVVLLLTA